MISVRDLQGNTKYWEEGSGGRASDDQVSEGTSGSSGVWLRKIVYLGQRESIYSGVSGMWLPNFSDDVLVPDMFHGNPWKKGQSISEFEHWLTAHSSVRVGSDIEMSAKWLTDEFLSAGISKKLGIIGFHFGGVRMIEMLAKDEQGIFGAGVCFYGMPMKTSLAKDVNVPVLFISGDNDPLCPVNELLDMERSIRGAKVMIYKGRGHEFAHRPKSQEEDVDAENAFIATRKWLQNGF